MHKHRPTSKKMNRSETPNLAQVQIRNAGSIREGAMIRSKPQAQQSCSEVHRTCSYERMRRLMAKIRWSTGHFRFRNRAHSSVEEASVFMIAYQLVPVSTRTVRYCCVRSPRIFVLHAIGGYPKPVSGEEDECCCRRDRWMTLGRCKKRLDQGRRKECRFTFCAEGIPSGGDIR